MQKWILTISAVAALGLASWGCCGLTKHVIVAVDSISEAARSAAETGNSATDMAQVASQTLSQAQDTLRVAQDAIQTIAKKGVVHVF